MSRVALVVTVLVASLALADKGETGVLGVGDPMELGVIAGPWQTTGTQLSKDDTGLSATLIGVRLHGGAYTHKTLLGNGGGVEANVTIGYALATKNYFWGQLDALANVGLFNHALGPIVVRLHVLVGFGFSLWSGTSLIGGGRLAIGVVPDIVSLEGTWLTLPTINGTFSHRAQANLVIKPIQLALGAELNLGSAIAGESHFALMGTVCWRPVFD
ncbi:MAG: hypothetical protein JNM69_19170 [Archangium sp.]|nr:hypothetical protein [Archangium sp.]